MVVKRMKETEGHIWAKETEKFLFSLTPSQGLVQTIGADVCNFVCECTESVLQCVYHLPARSVVYAAAVGLLHARTSSSFSSSSSSSSSASSQSVSHYSSLSLPTSSSRSTSPFSKHLVNTLVDDLEVCVCVHA